MHLEIYQIQSYITPTCFSLINVKIRLRNLFWNVLKIGIPLLWVTTLPPSVIRYLHLEATYCSELEGSKFRRRAILMLEDENTTLL